jgi:indole-3-glycerol phosphate synthase
MSTILDTIIAAKKKEIALKRIAEPAAYLEKTELFREEKPRSLSKILFSASSTGIIAEFKRKSPSKGWFKEEGFQFGRVAMQYDQHAAGISILTDREFFGGSLDDLSAARKITTMPLLRKDFILDEWQLIESKAYGADLVLLIAACLEPKAVKELARAATGLGLESILEIHDESELGHLCDEVSMVGINNRNLENFEVNIETSFRLIKSLPPEKPVIAESGIHDVNTIVNLREAGFRGFLVGEKFMKQAEPGVALEEFVQKLKKISP